MKTQVKNTTLITSCVLSCLLELPATVKWTLIINSSQDLEVKLSQLFSSKIGQPIEHNYRLHSDKMGGLPEYIAGKFVYEMSCHWVYMGGDWLRDASSEVGECTSLTKAAPIAKEIADANQER